MKEFQLSCKENSLQLSVYPHLSCGWCDFTTPTEWHVIKWLLSSGGFLDVILQSDNTVAVFHSDYVMELFKTWGLLLNWADWALWCNLIWKKIKNKKINAFTFDLELKPRGISWRPGLYTNTRWNKQRNISTKEPYIFIWYIYVYTCIYIYTFMCICTHKHTYWYIDTFTVYI